MPFKFEKLDIWKLGLNYATGVHNLTRKFPKEELFNLSQQFKSAADSISLNIAEGSVGQSNAEQGRFLGYAIRSTAECVNCLYLPKERRYVSDKEFDDYYKKAEEIFAKTIKFRNRLDGSPINGQSSMVKNT